MTTPRQVFIPPEHFITEARTFYGGDLVGIFRPRPGEPGLHPVWTAPYAKVSVQIAAEGPQGDARVQGGQVAQWEQEGAAGEEEKAGDCDCTK
jgi:hypothetical protein